MEVRTSGEAEQKTTGKDDSSLKKAEQLEGAAKLRWKTHQVRCWWEERLCSASNGEWGGGGAWWAVETGLEQMRRWRRSSQICSPSRRRT